MESDLESLKIMLTQQAANKNKQHLPTSPTKVAMSSNSSPTSPQPVNSHKRPSNDFDTSTKKIAQTRNAECDKNKTGSDETNGQKVKVAHNN